MPLDIGLWRVDGAVRRLSPAGMPTEQRLEDLIEADPSVLGQPLLIIGRQVITTSGKRLDLLGLDGEGALHVLELKRNKTPRDVIAQTLDYGSWAQSLTHDDILNIYQNYAGGAGRPMEVAFEGVFGVPLPEELNTGHLLTVVAADLDPESERIVEYLAEAYEVPINVVFFRYFADGDREYVARTWLIDRPQEAGPPSKASRSQAPWNGTDWFVSFGDDATRSWDDAASLGFVSAGGGEWYSRSLRTVPEGARVWAYVPRVGYVGVGTVTGPAEPFTESPWVGQASLHAPYRHDNGEDEWALPVTWTKTVPKSGAVWERGMFANQHSACKMRNAFTLDRLRVAFGLPED